MVPYNTLLHKGTREAVGLRLKGSVVIIDEAHNLLDSIAQVYSAQLSGYQVLCSFTNNTTPGLVHCLIGPLICQAMVTCFFMFVRFFICFGYVLL